MHRVLLALAIPLLTSTAAPAADAPLSATTLQRVHPVLIRNPRNELAEVTLVVRGTTPVRVGSLTFDLKGTTSLDDVASLELVAKVGKGNIDAGTSVGPEASPSQLLTFPVDHALKPGTHTYWLSTKLRPTADLSHRVAATCTAIDTPAGKVTPEDLRPGPSHRIGVALRRHKDDGVHTYRIPALTTSRSGTLLCVYDMRRDEGRDLQGDIDIGLSRSTDGGRNWEPVRVIMDMGTYKNLPQSQNGCSDPGIVVDRGTGEIFCFAVWMNGKPGKHQWNGDGSEAGFEIGKSAQLLMIRSKDDGLTWTRPENLTRVLKKPEWWLLAPSPQSGFTLPDGTLVMPMQGRDAKGIPFATIMTSKDHGTTWDLGSPAFSDGNECQAARLGDGSILLNIRNDLAKFRAVFSTKDLGKTWTPHPTHSRALIEPNCNASLLRFDLPGKSPDHVLIFSNPHSQAARTHQTIQVSLDDGLTWPDRLHTLLDEGRGAGYSSLTQIDATHLGIVYEGSRSHLTFERFPIADLLPVR